MKKFLTILICSFIVLGISGCGSKEKALSLEEICIKTHFSFTKSDYGYILSDENNKDNLKFTININNYDGKDSVSSSYYIQTDDGYISVIYDPFENKGSIHTYPDYDDWHDYDLNSNQCLSCDDSEKSFISVAKEDYDKFIENAEITTEELIEAVSNMESK